ncbi:MAG: hypothetical protein ACO2PP_13240 [Thermocrinis sp.]|uniref:hypothetical protein n=1 Tax=Thermocrinis sp. TaxID=2024383 RepID=UPI003C109BEF
MNEERDTAKTRFPQAVEFVELRFGNNLFYRLKVMWVATFSRWGSKQGFGRYDIFRIFNDTVMFYLVIKNETQAEIYTGAEVEWLMEKLRKEGFSEEKTKTDPILDDLDTWIAILKEHFEAYYGIIGYKDILEELRKDKEGYGGDWDSVLEFYGYEDLPEWTELTTQEKKELANRIIQELERKAKEEENT